MTKEISSEKKIYSLFGGGTTTNKTLALVNRKDFVKNFRLNWDQGDADKRLELIAYIAELPPEEGIDLVFTGMQDFTRKVKLETKKVLVILAKKITFTRNQIISRKNAVRSEMFARRIYLEMSETMALEELEMYLSLLTGIGGRGPFFAWIFFIEDRIPQNIFIDILNKLPEQLRLRFIYCYFTAEISERRQRAGFAENLLKGIADVNEAALFLEAMIEKKSDCPHATIALGGTLLEDFIDRVKIVDKILQPDLKTKNDREKILCLKLAGIMGKADILLKFIPFLDKSESRKVRIACIETLGRACANNTPEITESLLPLLEDDDPHIIIKVLCALIKLDVPDIVNIACRLISKQTKFRVKLYQCLCDMKAEQLTIVFASLPEPLSTDARKIIGSFLIRKNPERLEALLDFYRNNSDNTAKEAAEELFNNIQHIKKKEYQRVCDSFIPESCLILPETKKIIKKQSAVKQLKKLRQLMMRNQEVEARVCDIFFNIDLKGFKIETVDFSGSVFLNANLSSVCFKNICLKNVCFEKSSLKNALFENVVFDHCVFLKTDADAACFKSCSLIESTICESSFKFADMSGAYFTGATIIKCDFSKAALPFASFTGARLYLNKFNYAFLFQTDFSFSKGMLCDFSGTNFMDISRFEQSNLNARLKDREELKIPTEFYEKKLLATRWFNILALTHEMDKQRGGFLKYNKRRKECALDAFKRDQEDLFEIIPLLLHLPRHLIPVKNKNKDTVLLDNIKLKNMSSGIYGYVPTPHAIKLTKSYLNCEKISLESDKKHYIEALFTIGSVGTIAQSSESDIDYWVCINRETMSPEAVDLLKLKLDSIEKWAKLRFSTEVHFFIVDETSIREGNFGGSDFESSGSAQGMILKEEFYRTMILVAGKIPFWSVLPVWAGDKYYTLFYAMANRFHNDYLDFGNVSIIPSGEYFGASMWQLFKSLTSPYKSVMKMALLGQYIQEKKESRLLCNRLKKEWATGKCNLRYQDPYLMLFEEITAFYSGSDQTEVPALVRLCFFLKLGIRSMKDLDKSIFKIRKRLIKQCIEIFEWDEFMLCELGYFDEWSFEKISEFSYMINSFMIETYRRLSTQLNKSKNAKAMITDRDLTILGRKMFVHFVKHPHKVDKLPHLTKGRALFNQLYIYYRQEFEKNGSWEVYRTYYKKEKLKKNDKAILKGMDHIEQIVAWIIQNQLLKTGTIFNIIPNPTQVSARDFNELIHKMDLFFTADAGDTLSPAVFLEQYKAHKLYIIINFTEHRKAEKIFDYVAIYLTTWGELFCRAYKSKTGLNSLSDATKKISRDLNLSLENTKIGYHIPRMSGKRIKKV